MAYEKRKTIKLMMTMKEWEEILFIVREGYGDGTFFWDDKDGRKDHRVFLRALKKLEKAIYE